MKLESNWLTSSHTVAGIQNFFGLELLERPQDTTTITSQQNGTTTANGHDRNSNHTNGAAVHHRGKTQNGSVEKESSVAEGPTYRVNNRFWYWVFAFGASLGDDIFYYTVYPFWFYNLSPWVIRRVMLMWGLIMYVGQSSKEIMRWPRPSEPPAVRIEKRYFKEYGMPSTHAMVGTLVPFTILATTWNHYEYSHTAGVIIASSYTLLVCFSRLYRGMHYILDIVVGTSICLLLLALILLFIDELDHFLLTHPTAPVLTIAAVLFLSYLYPCNEQWSSSRNDTTMCLACVSGVMIASWISHHLGWAVDVSGPVVNPIVWPGWTSIGLMLLREVIGVGIMVCAQVASRATILAVLSVIMGRKIDRKNDPQNFSVEFPFKLISYFCIVCAMVLVSPLVFKVLHIPIYTVNV